MRRRSERTAAIPAALLALVVLMVLHGCGSTPTEPAPATTAPAPATQAAPAAKTPRSLVAERRWLQQWFKDTPVRIVQHGSGDVSVEVPLKYCFDDAQTAVLPPLGAVLDKLAESLQRVPQSQLQLIAAPADAKGQQALGVQRAAAVRDQLRSRGVPAGQLGEPALAAGTAVRLRLTLDAP